MDTTGLCAMMDELARQSWNDIIQVRQWGLHRGEVTITEGLLMALKNYERQANLGFDLCIVPTSQATERRSGADFDIWLQIGPNRYFPYSIQAKKATLSGTGGSYDTLGHRGHAATLVGPNARKGAPFQYDTLIAHAAQNQTIPMHVFYNGWEIAPADVVLTNPPDEELYGCAVLPTQMVKAVCEANLRSEHRIKAYAPHLRPWSVLFRRHSMAGFGIGPVDGPGGSGFGSPLDTSNEGDVFELGMTFGLDVRERPEGLPPYVSHAIRVSEDGRGELPDNPVLPRFAILIRDPRWPCDGVDARPWRRSA